MKNEDWINTFVNKFNESKDYKITDVRDREKLLDELRPTGEWEERTQGFACSKCDYYDRDYYEHNFCPFCGVRMKKEVEGNE